MHDSNYYNIQDVAITAVHDSTDNTDKQAVLTLSCFCRMTAHDCVLI